jgi:hypothetical protein
LKEVSVRKNQPDGTTLEFKHSSKAFRLEFARTSFMLVPSGTQGNARARGFAVTGAGATERACREIFRTDPKIFEHRHGQLGIGLVPSRPAPQGVDVLNPGAPSVVSWIRVKHHELYTSHEFDDTPQEIAAYYDGLAIKDLPTGLTVNGDRGELPRLMRTVAILYKNDEVLATLVSTDRSMPLPNWAGKKIKSGEVWKNSLTVGRSTADQLVLGTNTVVVNAVPTIAPTPDRTPSTSDDAQLEGVLEFFSILDDVSIS